MRFRSSVIIAVLWIATGLARGQTAGQQQPDETLPGFKANNLLEAHGIDNVNLFSGDPGIAIPIGPKYPLGPNSSWQLMAHYSAKFWGMYQSSCIDAPSGIEQRASILGFPTLGLGWDLGVGYVARYGVYHSPEGGSHGGQTAELIDGETSTYTDDGSRLLITRSTTTDGPATTYRVEFPDGTIQHFDHFFIAPTSSSGDTPLGFPTPDYENQEPSWMEPLNPSQRKPAQFWGLTEIDDRFGNVLLTVSYVGLPGTASAWQIDHITLSSGKTIRFTWGTVSVVDANNNNPIWPVLNSIAFPAAAGQTLTVSFAHSPHSFTRNPFDQGTLTNAYCAAPATSTAPTLDSISFSGGGITGTYKYSFTTDWANANLNLLGTLTRVVLPTGGSISYAYDDASGGGSSICSDLIYPAGQCSDPETGITANGPNAPILAEPSPGPKAPFRSYMDHTPSVKSRTDSDGVTTYNRYTYVPVYSTNLNQAIAGQAVRRVLVSRPDGNGGTVVTKYLLHVPDPDSGSGDSAIELERRLYAIGASGTETPIRTVINCHSADYVNGFTANPNDTATCGFRKSASTFQTYYLIGNVRQKAAVTWFGANPISSDGGGSCSDATTPCLQSANSQYNFPFNASVPNSTNLSDAGHYRVTTVSGLNVPGISENVTRTTTTDWIPPSSVWLSELYDSKTTSDSGSLVGSPSAITTGYAFDTTNGFLNSVSTTDSNGTLTVTHTNDGLGNPKTIARKGSGTGLSSTVFTDSLAFQNGLAISQLRSGIVWKSFDVTRDSATGLITQSRDPNSLQTAYSYDSLGRLKLIDPPGSSSASPPGEASTFVCYDSPTMTTVYRIVTDPGCASDASTTAAFLAWERYTYDGQGRLSREIKQLPGSFAVRLHSYDAGGHEAFISEWTACSSASTCATSAPTAGTRSSNFDPFDRPRTVTKADGTCTWFDRTDGAILYSDTYEKNAAFGSSCTGTLFPTATPVSGPTFTRKDILGRVISVQEGTASDIVNGVATQEAPTTTYTYDVLDKVAQVTQGSQVRKFTYDAFGFLRSEQNPEKGSAGNGTTTYGPYDALGNVLGETDNGISYTSTYDAAGRVKNLATNENTSTTYLTNTYDANFSAVAPYNYSLGRLSTRIAANTGVLGSSVTDTFTYGTAGTGQLSGQTTQISPGLSATQSWTYNASGLVAAHNHPRSSGAFPVTYSYSLGLPTSIIANGTSVATGISYNPAGVLKAWTDGQGVTTTIASGVIPTRPTRISTSDAGFDTQTYTYDAAGNVLAIGADTFRYDTRSRLVSAFYSGQTSPCTDSLANASRGQCFTYDRFGNLMAVAGNGSRTLTTSAATNRLTAGTGTTYDARGNLTFFGGETLTWDGLNRQIRDQSSASRSDWKYLYDGANERVGRIPASGTAFYTFRDEHGRLTTEYAGTAAGRDNVFLGNLMVASYASSALSGAVGWTYYHSDHLGTPRYITGVEGPARPKYWPYGDEVAPNTTSQKLRFATMERDLESNHFYDHARSHDLNIARFTSVDKLLDATGNPWKWNRYAYTGSNPLTYIDISGRERAIPPAVLNLSEHYVTAHDKEYRDVGRAIASVTHADEVREAFQGWSNDTLIEKGMAIAVGAIAIADVGSLALAPEEKTVTRAVVMLGHYPEYLTAAKKFGAFAFDIGKYWTPPANEKFMNRAIARGAQFLLATDPSKVRAGSTLAKELAMLAEKGYRIVADDFTGLWKLVK